MSKNSGKTILLLGNYRPCLPVAKTLAQRGYTVVVGDKGYEGGSENSRYVSSMWPHPCIKNEGARLFQRELMNYCSTHPNLVGIFPVSEEYVRFFAEPDSDWSTLAPIISNNSSIVNTCFDKVRLMNLAVKLGIPIAKFGEIDENSKLETVADAIGYPQVVRPMNSTDRLDGKKALIIENLEHLKRVQKAHELETRHLLLQRQFNGVRHNLYFAALNGKIVRLGQLKVAQTDRMDGTGLALSGETIKPCFGLREQTSAMLAALNYTGIGCIQFLVNSETSQTCFLEINPRIAGNHKVAEQAGLHLCDFLVDLVLHKKTKFAEICGATDIRFAWTSAHIKSIKDQYLSDEISGMTALNQFKTALVNSVTANCHIVFSITDPLPGLKAIWAQFPRLDRWNKPENTNDILQNEEVSRV